VDDCLPGCGYDDRFPGRNDSWFVGAASRSYYADLLNAEIKIYEYKDGLLHTKSLTLDGEVTLIGSANMDRRGFELNYESNTCSMIPHSPVLCASASRNTLRGRIGSQRTRWRPGLFRASCGTTSLPRSGLCSERLHKGPRPQGCLHPNAAFAAGARLILRRSKPARYFPIRSR
jgi:hypothetical protein